MEELCTVILILFVCLLVGCVSHESLLCVNEGLASLEVDTDPPPIFPSLAPYCSHMMSRVQVIFPKVFTNG